jgi:hypothetical protein
MRKRFAFVAAMTVETVCRDRHSPSVVPAQAGTHNHREYCGGDATGPASLRSEPKRPGCESEYLMLRSIAKAASRKAFVRFSIITLHAYLKKAS